MSCILCIGVNCIKSEWRKKYVCSSKDKLARINELAKKAKETGLTELEAKEQSKLRAEYLQTFRSSMLNTLKSVNVIDPEGNDVTPEKLKKLQRNNDNRLH